MPRTKADKSNCARRAVAAKAPRKNLGVAHSPSMSGNTASPAGKKGKFSGGNSACPRPTPEWQKEITTFLIQSPKSSTVTKHKENVDPEEDEGAGPSNHNQEEAACSSSSSSSSSRAEPSVEADQEEESDIDSDAGASGEASSSKTNFARNNCISDDDDDC